MMRYLVKVSYNGSAYFGWQRQKNVSSVQELIENKISTIFNQEIIIHASGRTDAKVHARGQVFHFDADKFPLQKLKYALNKMLPSDILIKSIKMVKPSFHARFAVKMKEYEYLICPKAKDPFLNDRVLFYPQNIDLPLLTESVKALIGTHNFQNFTSKTEDEDGFIRTVFDVKIRVKKGLISVIFFGNGFMRGQIRMMVGALLAINQEKEKESFITDKINEVERNIISYKVSGSGLYLNKVYY